MNNNDEKIAPKFKRVRKFPHVQSLWLTTTKHFTWWLFLLTQNSGVQGCCFFFFPKLDNWWWLHRDWCRKQERVRCQIRCMDKSELLLRKAIALSPCSLATGTLLNHNSSVPHTNQSGYKVNQMTMAHRGNVPRVFSNARRDISILYFSYVSGELLRTTGTHSGLLLKLKICRNRISVFGSEVDAKRGC